MTDPTYTAAQVEAAARQGLGEMFGESSPAIDVFTNRILGHLVLDGAQVSTASDAERTDSSQPPRYAERAMDTDSPEELAALAGSACERLRRSVSSYLNENDSFSTHDVLPSGVYRLRPWIFKEGARGSEGEGFVGELFIDADLFGNGPGRAYYDRRVLSLWLKGGEDAPYNKLDDTRYGGQHSERLFEIRERVQHHTSTGADVVVKYATAQAGYSANTSDAAFPNLYRSNEQDPRLVAMIKADVFWALDMAITYYENVHVTVDKHAGLSYADYREAGCLDDQGYIDRAKAEGYIRQQYALRERTGDDSPSLGDWETKVVTMNPMTRMRVRSQRLFGISES